MIAIHSSCVNCSRLVLSLSLHIIQSRRKLANRYTKPCFVWYLALTLSLSLSPFSYQRQEGSMSPCLLSNHKRDRRAPSCKNGARFARLLSLTALCAFVVAHTCTRSYQPLLVFTRHHSLRDVHCSTHLQLKESHRVKAIE
jgi:hypothetical protein